MQAAGQAGAPAGVKLFVSNLPYSCTWTQLKDTFSQVPGVVRADVAMNHDGRSRGNGTVVFGTLEEAQKAIEAFDGVELDGRRMGVRFDRDSGYGAPAGPAAAGGYRAGGGYRAPAGQSAGPGTPGVKVFVSNLPYSCTWMQLKDTFNQVPGVVRADVFMREGRSRGMGTVVFNTPEEAQKAIEAFDGVELDGRRMGVRFDRDGGAAPPQAA